MCSVGFGWWCEFVSLLLYESLCMLLLHHVLLRGVDQLELIVDAESLQRGHVATLHRGDHTLQL